MNPTIRIDITTERKIIGIQHLSYNNYTLRGTIFQNTILYIIDPTVCFKMYYEFILTLGCATNE